MLDQSSAQPPFFGNLPTYLEISSCQPQGEDRPLAKPVKKEALHLRLLYQVTTCVSLADTSRHDAYLHVHFIYGYPHKGLPFDTIGTQALRPPSRTPYAHHGPPPWTAPSETRRSPELPT